MNHEILYEFLLGTREENRMKRLKKLAILVTFLAVMAFSIAPMDVEAAVVDKGVIVFGQSYSGSKPKGERHNYELTLSKSGKISFVSTASNSNYPYIVIIDSLGEEVASNRLDKESGTAHELLAGTYTVCVRSQWDWQFDYSFVPYFEESGETVTENYMAKNNEVGTPTSYTIGKTFKGQLAKNDNIDIYKTKVSSKGMLSFNVTNHSVNGLSFTIKDAMGNVSYEESNITAGLHKYKYFCPKGTYYITFTSNKTGTYTFKSSLKKGVPAVKLTQVKKARYYGTKCLKVAWSKNQAVSGYQIQYSKYKNFKKKKNLYADDATQNKMYISNLKRGKYYVRIRSYITINGENHYSSWSKAKKFTS